MGFSLKQWLCWSFFCSASVGCFLDLCHRSVLISSICLCWGFFFPTSDLGRVIMFDFSVTFIPTHLIDVWFRCLDMLCLSNLCYCICVCLILLDHLLWFLLKFLSAYMFTMISFSAVWYPSCHCSLISFGSYWSLCDILLIRFLLSRVPCSSYCLVIFLSLISLIGFYAMLPHCCLLFISYCCIYLVQLLSLHVIAISLHPLLVLMSTIWGLLILLLSLDVLCYCHYYCHYTYCH